MLRDIFFFLFAIGVLSGAMGVVLLRNPFYAVLSLVVHLLSLALLFLLLQAQFLAAAQVIVYAGAVIVLYVFVVAYVGSSAEPIRASAGPGLRALSILFATALAVELLIAVVGSTLAGIDGDGAKILFGFGTPSFIGELLLTRFLFPFELATVLLLMAAVGAVVLARRRGGIESAGDVLAPLQFGRRPLGTGTMKEGVGDINPTAELSRSREQEAPVAAVAPRAETAQLDPEEPSR